MADPTMNAGPNRSDRRFLGIDVGGTNIKAGVVDDNGIVISTSSVPTESEKGPDHGVQQMHKVAMKAIRDADLSPADIHAVGLATPGTMDIPAGMLLDPPNLPGWKDFPVRQRVADAMQLPVVLQNDANAAAYGEYWAGSAKEANSLIFFTLGTGLGSGIIIDDFIIEGEHSHGAECGHTIIEMDDGRLCPTGQYGTGEAYCSATALLKMFEEAIESGRTSSVQQRINESTAISPLIIAEEAEHGDKLSAELIMEMARCLGVSVTSAVHVIDPNMVLLGGAMTFGRNETKVGREFLNTVRREFHSRTFRTIAHRIIIDYASLGGNAGFIGAAGCARRALDRNQLPR